jgi:hypothetical protein
VILRACIVCGRFSERSRCERHRLPPHAQRYGREHRRRRTALLPAAIGMPCPLCGELMLPDQALDLDHSTPLWCDPRSKGDRIVHAKCNRGRAV